jgi:nucleotide-binding universal stress UspA family protein
VAVSGDGGGHAAEWAAAEAAARGSALHVVHVMPSRWIVDPSSLVPLQDISGSVTAGDVVRTAVSRAAAVVPDLEISAEVLAGPTGASVLRAAAGSQLLVLGAPYQGRVRRLSAFSLSARVAARARCPVVLVKRLLRGRVEGRSPHVVVGVDATGSSTAALGFAFRAAAQRGLPLTVVHAWTPDPPADLEAVSGPVAGTESSARSALDQALSDWARRFPDVAVQPRLVCSDPAAALVRESEGAALVVVGSRGRGTLRGTAFGSVSRRVVLRARCPAVVVRPDAGTPRSSVVLRADPTTQQPTRRRQAPWG